MMGNYGQPVQMNGLNPGQHRDNQRKRLYTADDVIDGLRVSALAKRHLTDSVRHSYIKVWSKGDPDAPIEDACVLGPLYYPSVESTQDYVDAVTSASWFRRRWGYRRIPVQHSHGGGSAAWQDGSISISVEHRRCEASILHEIAHQLTPQPYAHHGPEFAGVLLTLVKHVMGAEYAARLRESFRENRVRYRMTVVPAPDEDRRVEADHRAKRRGFRPRKATRTKAAAPRTRKPPKSIETVEEMTEVGRKAALRGSDWDRAEAAATRRGVGDLRFEAGRRAFSYGYGEIRDRINAGEMPDPRP